MKVERGLEGLRVLVNEHWSERQRRICIVFSYMDNKEAKDFLDVLSLDFAREVLEQEDMEQQFLFRFTKSLVDAPGFARVAAENIPCVQKVLNKLAKKGLKGNILQYHKKTNAFGQLDFELEQLDYKEILDDVYQYQVNIEWGTFQKRANYLVAKIVELQAERVSAIRQNLEDLVKELKKDGDEDWKWAAWLAMGFSHPELAMSVVPYMDNLDELDIEFDTWIRKGGSLMEWVGPLKAVK